MSDEFHLRDVAPRVIGLNLGHDAGIATCNSENGVLLVEMERIVRHRHACGGSLGVREAFGAVFDSFLGAERAACIGIADFVSPRAHYADAVILAADHDDWECRGVPRPEQLVRPLKLGSIFPSLDAVSTNAFLVRHHWAHAQVAYFASPFDSKTLVVCLDGTGCFADCGIVCVGEEEELTPVAFLTNAIGPRFGLVYEAFARRLFGSQFATGKVLGLAAYGMPRPELEPFVRLLFASNGMRRRFPELFDPVPERQMLTARLRYGDVWFNYDAHCGGFLDRHCKLYGDYTRSFGASFPDAFSWDEKIFEPRFASDDDTSRDLAATLQWVYEDELMRFLNKLAHLFPGCQRLCFAGGCALNVSANSRILAETPFREVFIPSCCDDSGIALGTALAVSVEARRIVRSSLRTATDLAFAGAPLRDADRLDRVLAGHRDLTLLRPLDRDDLIEQCAEMLATGQTLGWIEGRCETGPRALGHRSLLASPMVSGMKQRVSVTIKAREAFRPVAPLCPKEDLDLFFEGPPTDASTMLFNFRVRPSQRGLLSEVSHVDGTARVQTVERERSPNLHALLRSFERRIGIPVLINTSLNARSEPMVNSAEDALALLKTTSLDGIVFVDQRVLCIKHATRATRT